MEVEPIHDPFPPAWEADRPAGRLRRWAGTLVILAMVLIGLVALWLQHRGQ